MLDAREVSKRFLLRHNVSGSLKVRFLGLFHRSQQEAVEEFWALRDVSLQIGHGESVGLIGRNGSGKSTFLKLVAAIHRPTGGRLLVARDARIGSMIELGVGFHPELNGTENVYLNAAIHGLSRPDIDSLYGPIVRYSGLEHFMDVPLKNYSSGMHMRLGFAIAANLDPDILLLDEIFAVGDEAFQKQCMRTLKDFEARGKTILFVSHSPAAIQAICHRVCVLDHGELRYDGDVESGLDYYQRLVTTPAAGEPAGNGDAARRTSHLVDAEPDLAWHRLATGPDWEATGAWAFEFMRRQGLQPGHSLLEVGCGSLAAARLFLPYLDADRYWGFEQNRELFEAGVRVELPQVGVKPERGHFIVNNAFNLGDLPRPVDFALAPSLFTRLSLNRIVRCVASVLKRLEPGGRFYATWFDNPDIASVDPIERPHGVRTYPDTEPYHCPFEILARVFGALGADVERVAEAGHPRGESVMLITRRQAGTAQGVR